MVYIIIIFHISVFVLTQSPFFAACETLCRTIHPPFTCRLIFLPASLPLSSLYSPSLSRSTHPNGRILLRPTPVEGSCSFLYSRGPATRKCLSSEQKAYVVAEEFAVISYFLCVKRQDSSPGTRGVLWLASPEESTHPWSRR